MNNIHKIPPQKSKIKNEQELNVFDEPANLKNEAIVHQKALIIEKIIRGLSELDEEDRRDVLKFAIKIRNRKRDKKLATIM